MSPSADVILVVDDEPQIRRAVVNALRGTAARIVEAGTGSEGLDVAAAARPDLVVLDLGLPDMSGLDVCRELRRWTMAPIVVLSARHAEAEKIQLLDAGADDYITKPFSLGEFVARVQAQLRRAAATRTAGASEPIEVDGLSIDLARRVVRRGDVPVRLTRIEWLLLQALAAQAGRTLTHQQIFDAVWGRSYGNPQQYLRVHLTNLRRKIERDPATPRIIVTEPGVGYRFERGPA